jgi:hypothetical protein
VQLEATVQMLHSPARGGFAIFEARVLRVHIHADLVVPGTNHVNTDHWQPLFYVFRHYFGTAPTSAATSEPSIDAPNELLRAEEQRRSRTAGPACQRSRGGCFH